MADGVRVGGRLKEVRVRRLLTQEELSEKAGVSAGTIIKIEQDRTRPRFRTIRKLAEALGVEPSELVQG